MAQSKKKPVEKQVDSFISDLDEVLSEIRSMLIAKNSAYGDSALNPVRVFSKADIFSQLDVRMDDKLSRIRQGKRDDEDPERDLVGYLVIKGIQRIRVKRTRQQEKNE